MNDGLKCSVCHQEFDDSELYEYRGVIACDKHFDIAIAKKDIERSSDTFDLSGEESR